MSPRKIAAERAQIDHSARLRPEKRTPARDGLRFAYYLAGIIKPQRVGRSTAKGAQVNQPGRLRPRKCMTVGDVRQVT